MEMEEWEARFEAYLEERSEGSGDSAHDLEHTRRVVANARVLAGLEGADLEIVIPAAWLHDCVHVPKDSDRRSEASRLAADSAGGFLRTSGYPPSLIPAIEHAIHAHSFSAGVAPRSVEARVLQDADRLDALGAIGLARMLMTGGAMRLSLYAPEEPVPRTRTPDERRYALDHCFTKLLRLESSMQTTAGRAEAELRTEFIRAFLDRLSREIGGVAPHTTASPRSSDA